jgi:transcriptional regulator with XRE-family HTH domain
VRYDPAVTFREILRGEIARRQQQNRRYSLRRFARQAGVHHATISRWLRSSRPAPERLVRAVGGRIGISSPDVERVVLAENEAAVVLAIGRTAFRTSSRWLATVTGLPIDSVNIALQSLLRKGAITMPARERWTVNRSMHE